MSGPTGPVAPPPTGKPTAPVGPSSSPMAPTATASVPCTLPISQGTQTGVQRAIVYGPGGVGKSELCSLLRQLGKKVLFCDTEDSTRFLDVARVQPTTWTDLRAAIRDLSGDYDVVVVDSLTKGEELCVQHVLDNVPHEKGLPISGIEDYGWGKGYVHVYEEFLKLLGDLDALGRQGKYVVGVCHDCVATVPNPGGDDWIRYEPRLQMTGRASIRHRVKEWCDHLLYIGFDTIVKDGKAMGSGTRTIYPTEMPTHWAKSRLLSNPVPYPKGDATIWKLLFEGGI